MIGERCLRSRISTFRGRKRQNYRNIETLSHFRIINDSNALRKIEEKRREMISLLKQTSFFFSIRKNRSFAKAPPPRIHAVSVLVHHHFFLPPKRDAFENETKDRESISLAPLHPPHSHHSRATRGFEVRWTFFFFFPTTHHFRSHP